MSDDQTEGAVDSTIDEELDKIARRRLSSRPLRRPLAMMGLVVIVGWIVIAVVISPLYSVDPLALGSERLAGPGPGHWFGTDQLGRDVLARTMAGSRTTLPLAVVLVASSLLIGGFLGAVAGYLGGIADEVIMRIADIVFAFPTIILAMVVAAVLGPSLTNAVIAMLVVTWPSYARVMRSLVIGVRTQEYVLVGRLLGLSAARSMARDVLPNVIAPLVVLATLDIGTAILLLSGMGFLGLGALPPTPDWGLMVSDGVRQFEAWWMSVFPGLAIFTVVLAFNFLGDALRDQLDPRTASSIGDRSI